MPLQPGAGRAASLALLLYALLSVAFSWPLAARLNGALPAGPADPMLSITILNWDWQQLAALNFSGYFAASFVHPYPLGLAYGNHLTGLALPGLPLWLAGVSPLAIYNLLVLAGYALSAIAAFLLARELSGSRAGAFLAGLIFAFAPYRLARLGHLEVMHSWGIPLALLCLVLLLRRPRPAMAILLALVFVWQALVNMYFMYYLVLLLPLALLCFAPAQAAVRQARLWLCLLLAVVLAGACLLPFLLPYSTLRAEVGTARSAAELFVPQGWHNFLGAPAANLVWGRWLSANDIPEGGLFPGACALLLAGCGLFARMPVAGARRLALMLLVLAVLFTAGPQARLGPLDAGAVYRAGFAWLPGFDGMRVTTRWHAVTLLALGLLAAYGWVAVRRRLRGRVLPALLAGALALAIVGESYQPPALWSFPAALQRPAIIRHLRGLPAGAVIQLPLDWFNNLHLYHSVVHGHAVVQAGNVPPVPLVETLLQLQPAAPATMPLLASLGVRYVVVRNAADTGGAWRRACTADTRLQQLAADDYGVLFALAGRGGNYLAMPADLADLRGERRPDGSAIISLALPGADGRPVITRQRFFTGELALRADGRELRRQVVRFELPPLATGTQRAAAVVADAAGANELVLTVAGRDFNGGLR